MLCWCDAAGEKYIFRVKVQISLFICPMMCIKLNSDIKDLDDLWELTFLTKSAIPMSTLPRYGVADVFNICNTSVLLVAEWISNGLWKNNEMTGNWNVGQLFIFVIGALWYLESTNGLLSWKYMNHCFNYLFKNRKHYRERIYTWFHYLHW